MSNILIVAPHPDDETLGCAGVIAAKTRAGDDVHIVVLSDGSRLFQSALGIDEDPSPREVSDRRKRETEAAVAILGGNPANIQYLDYRDGSLGEHRAEIVRRLMPIFDELQPTEVYVTDAYEYHTDHRAANRIVLDVLDALEDAPALFQYFVGPKEGFAIDEWRERIAAVDISEFYELKKTAIQCFQCHLRILSLHQTQPIWTSADADYYLHHTEKFIVRKTGPKE